MKIYVDELPKDCIDCPCESEYYCNLLNEDIGCCEWGKIHKNCPLQSLADYTKQVREEVVEEIREKFNTEVIHHFCPNPSSVDFITLSISEVEEFLDQVKGANNGRKIRI